VGDFGWLALSLVEVQCQDEDGSGARIGRGSCATAVEGGVSGAVEEFGLEVIERLFGDGGRGIS